MNGFFYLIYPMYGTFLFSYLLHYTFSLHLLEIKTYKGKLYTYFIITFVRIIKVHLSLEQKKRVGNLISLLKG